MAGGLGTRMRSAVPKHLHPLLGRRMVDWVLEAARPLGLERLVVVVSPGQPSFTRLSFGVVVRAIAMSCSAYPSWVRYRLAGSPMGWTPAASESPTET